MQKYAKVFKKLHKVIFSHFEKNSRTVSLQCYQLDAKMNFPISIFFKLCPSQNRLLKSFKKIAVLSNYKKKCLQPKYLEVFFILLYRLDTH